VLYIQTVTNGNFYVYLNLLSKTRREVMTNDRQTVPIQLLKDKTIFNRLSEEVSNVVLVDFGCEFGDFLDQLTMFKSIIAIDVDSSLDVYSHSTKLKLYTKLIKDCVTNSNSNSNSNSNGNTISFNYYPIMPDVSSIYILTNKLTNDNQNKNSFYHYMPAVVQQLSNVESIEITVPVVTLNSILNTVISMYINVLTF